MSTYELDDDLVQRIVRGTWTPSTPMGAVAEALRKQLPLPVPTKIGAVVRTNKGVFLKADGSPNCWIEARAEEPFEDVPTWQFTGGIGRITEVLSEGVDL